MKNIDKIIFHWAFYFIGGLFIIISMIGHDYFKEVPSLYVIAAYLIGYGTSRSHRRDKEMELKERENNS